MNERHSAVASKNPPMRGLRKVISGLRLFPKTHDFFAYFEQVSEITLTAAKHLCAMLADDQSRGQKLKQLKDYEHQADKVTHEVIDLLRDTFLTPFDRMDLHTLIVRMDDILDIIYHIGNRLTRYNVSEVPAELIELGDLLKKSCEEVKKAVGCLRQHTKDTAQVLHHCRAINKLEREADDTINAAIEVIFSNGWDPYRVIKLKELGENLEAATDKCKFVGNIIEGIILKHA